MIGIKKRTILYYVERCSLSRGSCQTFSGVFVFRNMLYRSKYKLPQREQFLAEACGLEARKWMTESAIVAALRFGVVRNGYVYLSNGLKKHGITNIGGLDLLDKTYIYRLYACDMTYVGKTNDPLKRFVEHIRDSKASAGYLVETAMDNRIVPRLQVIDVTNANDAPFIEAYWINALKTVNASRLKAHFRSTNPTAQNTKASSAVTCLLFDLTRDRG